MKAGRAGLFIDVHVVVLDLGEIPTRVSIHNFFEGVQSIVERKTDVSNAPAGAGLLDPIQDTQVVYFVPALGAQGVHQVKVDVIGLQPVELLGKEALEIGLFIDQPLGQLGCQGYFLAVAVLQGPPDKAFAVAAVVAVGGVDVIHAAVDGIAQHAHGFRLVDLGIISVKNGQAHAAKAQG